MESNSSQFDLPKSALVTKLKGLINDAQNTPIDELCKEGDYKVDPQPSYPQTKGEYIVHELSALLLDQSWIEADTEPVLDEMISILGPLDMGVNKPKDWQELFTLVKEL